MVLDEGKNREIRRMLAALGHKVHQLKRVTVGSLSLGDLLPGQWRRLGWEEIRKLREETVPSAGGREAGRRPQGDGRPPRRTGSRRPGQRPGDRPPRDQRSGKAGRAGGGAGGKPSGKPGGGARRKRLGKASDWRRSKGGA
jgi:23S rRNA pseudouridine2605 synthase